MFGQLAAVAVLGLVSWLGLFNVIPIGFGAYGEAYCRFHLVQQGRLDIMERSLRNEFEGKAGPPHCTMNILISDEAVDEAPTILSPNLARLLRGERENMDRQIGFQDTIGPDQEMVIGVSNGQFGRNGAKFPDFVFYRQPPDERYPGTAIPNVAKSHDFILGFGVIDFTPFRKAAGAHMVDYQERPIYAQHPVSGGFGCFGRALCNSDRSFHVPRLLVSEGGEPFGFVVEALGGIPESDGRDSQNSGEQECTERRERLNPSRKVYLPAFIFGGVILGSLFFGLGFDFWYFRRQWTLGVLISLGGLLLSCYALFWPLLYGGY